MMMVDNISKDILDRAHLLILVEQVESAWKVRQMGQLEEVKQEPVQQIQTQDFLNLTLVHNFLILLH